GDYYRGPAQALSGRGLRNVSYRFYSVITVPEPTLPAQGHPGLASRCPVGKALPRQLAPTDLPGLAAQAEPLDERAVPGDVGLPQVGQQPTAAADREQQTTAAVVVVLMHLEVLVQVIDPAGHERDLDFRRAGVTLTGRVLREDLLLYFNTERHVSP